MIVCILTYIILLPIKGVLILLSPVVIHPIYFIFTGKDFLDSKFVDNLFSENDIDGILDWFYNKLL